MVSLFFLPLFVPSFGLFAYLKYSILTYQLDFWIYPFVYFPSGCSKYYNIHTSIFTIYLDLTFYHFKSNVETLAPYFLYVLVVVFVNSMFIEQPIRLCYNFYFQPFKELQRKIVCYSYAGIYHLSYSSFIPKVPCFPLVSFPFHLRTSFCNSFIADLLVMKSLSFHSFENVFISSSFVNEH